jgi:hypothetical protein
MLIFDRLEHERFLDGLRLQLDQAAWAAGWAAGRAMSLKEAVAYALSDDN